jgi:4-alpha-glucanotransferase
MSDARRFDAGRHAGALVPLFSIPSARSWGIGEIPDLPRFAEWLETAGLDIVQLLPVNEMADGQNSPYSALSAMAIDPLYIAVGEIEEFTAAGGEASLTGAERTMLAQARSAPSVQYRIVRDLKRCALRAAFARFSDREWQAGTARADTFEAFRGREAWWLDDYALFRALHQEQELRYWIEWEPGIRNRDPEALEAARERLATEVLYYAWLQWVADEQWQRARAACGRVGIFGDFPFMVGGDSADVWSRQQEFRVDASVGVPPDAFSATGQDWGLPAYRWDVMAPGGYEWLRQRARRLTELYDGFRVDHLVGFYRTFVREQDGTTSFFPAEEDEQLAQGERVLDVLQESGARIVVEDLGTVPDFVRESLVRLKIAGLKVMRWERHWHAEGQPFIDPAAYPSASVATSGTHDTEPLAEWWDAAPLDERTRVVEIPALRDAGIQANDSYSNALRDALLTALFSSGSDLLLLPVQDMFGWRDRVNTPAVVNDENWSWRLPMLVEDLQSDPAAAERAAFLRSLAQQHGRWSFR